MRRTPRSEMLFNYSDTVVEDVTISGILGGGSVLIRTGDL